MVNISVKEKKKGKRLKMLCPNCNTENDDSANFCTNCRTPLKDAMTTPTSTLAEPVKEESVEQPVTPAVEDPVELVVEPVKPATAPATPTTAASDNVNFFAFIIAGLLKPMTALKENLPKFSDIKNSIIFTVIITVISTILSLITAIYTTVREQSCTGGLFSEKKCELKFDFENLEDFKWFEVVGQNLLTTIAFIAVIAGIFFALSRAFKKNQTNYFKMLAVVSLAAVPMILATFVGGFIGYINGLIGIVVILLGTMYGFYIFHEGINDEVQLEGDKKIYYNIICVALLLVAFYIYLRFMFGELADAMFSGGFKLGGFSSGSSSSYSDYSKYLDF